MSVTHRLSRLPRLFANSLLYTSANRPQPIYRPGDVDDPAAPLRQALPPPRDGLQHADLGMVSGGMGEEGAARNHADG